MDTNFKRNVPEGGLEAVGMMDEHGAGIIDPDVIARANAFGPAALGVMDYALDPGTAARLWTMSAPSS